MKQIEGRREGCKTLMPLEHKFLPVVVLVLIYFLQYDNRNEFGRKVTDGHYNYWRNRGN